MKTKILFAVSAAAFVGFMVSLVILAFPESKEDGGKEDTIPKEAFAPEMEEEQAKEEVSISQETDLELERFRNEYGLEIPYQDMEEQVRIRREYEAAYQKTYSLEEVFLADVVTDPNVGDEGWKEEEPNEGISD